jgi:hypothetical protein
LKVTVAGAYLAGREDSDWHDKEQIMAGNDATTLMEPEELSLGLTNVCLAVSGVVDALGTWEEPEQAEAVLELVMAELHRLMDAVDHRLVRMDHNENRTNAAGGGGASVTATLPITKDRTQDPPAPTDVETIFALHPDLKRSLGNALDETYTKLNAMMEDGGMACIADTIEFVKHWTPGASTASKAQVGSTCLHPGQKATMPRSIEIKPGAMSPEEWRKVGEIGRRVSQHGTPPPPPAAPAVRRGGRKTVAKGGSEPAGKAPPADRPVPPGPGPLKRSKAK